MTAPIPDAMARLKLAVDAWRHIAHYYLGDFADMHGPLECRAEAVRRSVERGGELTSLIIAAEQRGAERERARVVAWLDDNERHGDWSIARDIERGEHRKT